MLYGLWVIMHVRTEGTKERKPLITMDDMMDTDLDEDEDSPFRNLQNLYMELVFPAIYGGNQVVDWKHDDGTGESV